MEFGHKLNSNVVLDALADGRKTSMPQFSIVIPCYRSGAWLEELVERLDTALTPLGQPFEVWLINDASLDDTWEVICHIARRFDFVRGVDLLFNVGQYRATLCGLQRASAPLVITMDDDLQHAPEDIPVLIAAICERPELDCIMARFAVKRHSLLRNLGSRLMNWLNTRLYGKPPDVTASSFRIMKQQLVQTLCRHGTANPILGPLIFRTTRRIANVEVSHHPRMRGTSGYRIGRLVMIVFDNFLSASTVPLRAVSALGLGSALLSVLLEIYFLLKYAWGGIRFPGFATQVLLITFFGGLTLLSIGLLGEYIVRIMEEVQGAPRYAVRETVGDGDA